MKVICIDNSNPLNPEKLQEGDMIYVGEIYTVEGILYQDNLQFYTLVERNRLINRVRYLASRFVPLSGEDEVETAEQDEECICEEI